MIGQKPTPSMTRRDESSGEPGADAGAALPPSCIRTLPHTFAPEFIFSRHVVSCVRHQADDVADIMQMMSHSPTKLLGSLVFSYILPISSGSFPTVLPQTVSSGNVVSCAMHRADDAAQPSKLVGSLVFSSHPPHIFRTF